MKQEQLNEILAKHKLWLEKKEGGERADLSFSDLRGADLRFLDLSFSDLRGADLRGADLRWANTQGVINYPLFSFRGGSRRRHSSYDAKLDIIHCGCWRGTLAEFEARVAKAYPHPQQTERSSYDSAIAEIKKQLNLNQK